MIENKVCTRCKEIKKSSDFYKSSLTICKSCRIEQSSLYVEKNLEKRKAYVREHYKKQQHEKGLQVSSDRHATEKGTKICSECRQVKQVIEFTKLKRNSDGLHNRCKECKTETVNKYIKNNKEKVEETKKRYHFNKMYGMTIDKYNKMVEEQNGVCKICGNPPTIHKRLSIDHCHVTNKIRGLLCSHCNTGLGNFNDSVSILQKAARYLNIPIERPKAIAIDLDDCIFSFIDDLIKLHNNTSDTKFNKEDIINWGLPKELAKTFKKYEKNIYDSLSIKNGSAKAVKIFREKGYKIIFITARNPKFRQETEFSLERAGVHYDELFFNSRKALKLNRLEELFFVHAFIDDKLETINSVKKTTKIKNVFLMNMPSNRNEEIEEGVVRINNLHEIKDIL